MRQFLESFGAAVETTGGLVLLIAYATLPVFVVYFLLMKAGRGYWSKGTESRRIAAARATLKKTCLSETDELYRSIAEDTLRYAKL